MRTISLRLDDHTNAILVTYCERHGLTQTDAVKAAIEQMAEAHRPTPAELAERFGLIGGFQSTEGDLAENHSQRVKERLRAKLARETRRAPPSQATTSAPPAAPRRSPMK
jgi:hypothetical protein